MRNLFGHHVSGAVDDGVHIVSQVGGSFEVYYGQFLELVVLELRAHQHGAGMASMAMTVDQAVLLRDLIDAAITDAKAMKPLRVLTDPKEVL
ncbi:hypothetical protein OHB26_03195 [Nocardia sp. NBC_01503]|uniref:hypothetical protein n=1 Tax=Nocardia sp. NBC_01503 TaxID=2975997 RepID=UPI002E7BFD21|nr:hypothetical protein [Nocardia sp. NBC_01503]WTL33270.1 hypothetical protein OHB26_03195 [Nocardia sp. NBC_01503]